jgi:hypothetical protein
MHTFARGPTPMLLPVSARLHGPLLPLATAARSYAADGKTEVAYGYRNWCAAWPASLGFRGCVLQLTSNGVQVGFARGTGMCKLMRVGNTHPVPAICLTWAEDSQRPHLC